MKIHLISPRSIGYLLLLTAASLGLLSVSYSRYVSQVQGEAVATAAVWGSDAQVTLDLDISKLAPGGTMAYSFIVTNEKEGKISQVAQQYTITFESTGNLPLRYRLLLKQSEPEGQGTAVVDAQGRELDLTAPAVAEGGFLPHTEKTSHTYQLKISWPENAIGAEYADEIDLVSLTVRAEQVMPE